MGLGSVVRVRVSQPSLGVPPPAHGRVVAAEDVPSDIVLLPAVRERLDVAVGVQAGGRGREEERVRRGVQHTDAAAQQLLRAQRHGGIGDCGRRLAQTAEAVAGRPWPGPSRWERRAARSRQARARPVAMQALDEAAAPRSPPIARDARVSYAQLRAPASAEGGRWAQGWSWWKLGLGSRLGLGFRLGCLLQLAGC